MKYFRSFSARLVFSTLVTACVTFAALLGLTMYRFNASLAEQTAQISALSEEKLSQRLANEARLAAARLVGVSKDIGNTFANIATRADVQAAIQSHNVVAISQVLGSSLAASDLDGILVVDANAQILGAHDTSIDLSQINGALHETRLAETVQSLAKAFDIRTSRTIHIRTKIDAAMSNLVGRKPGGFIDIVVRGVADDFGDLSAVLIGFRQLKTTEPVLMEFFRLTGSRVSVLLDGQPISLAGLVGSAEIRNVNSPSGLFKTEGDEFAARCEPLFDRLSVCAYASSTALEEFGRQMITIGESHNQELRSTLILGAIGCMALFAVISLWMSRQVTKPLIDLTRAVESAASGDWCVAVAGTDRTDEVGGIARAVEILKQSGMERDRLRVDVHKQNAVLIDRETLLRDQNLRFDAALNNMSQGLCMYDAEGRLIVSNAQFKTIYGLDTTLTSPGTSYEAILSDEIERELFDPGEIDHVFLQRRTLIANFQSVLFEQRLSDGRCIAITWRPMANGGWLETHEDVTERKESETRIAHLVRHDALTGLPNRMFFRECLEHALCKTAEPDRDIAVLCLDLDNFKSINDTLGHPAGDDLLRNAARRLQHLVDPMDTVARLGGDEFAVVVEGRGKPARIMQLAKRMVDALRQPYMIEGQEIVIGASIGVAVWNQEVKGIDELIKSADIALYRAKAEGKNKARLFTSEMDSESQSRRALERDLALAVARQELELYYQPFFNLKTNQIDGFEALLRWHHRERGTLSPAIFIPIAEEVGLIHSIGEWVLREACNEAAKWSHALKLAVNVSSVQFRSKTLAQIVIAALARSGLPASRMEIEVTESVLLHDSSLTAATLQQLSTLGVRLSMDDFGTGYSSLSCLRNFPFDKIKIDQSFVRDMLTSADCSAIVKTVSDLGHNLNMSTIAEGVETEAQLQQLRALGIDQIQGYLISKPVPARKLPALIERYNRRSIQAA